MIAEFGTIFIVMAIVFGVFMTWGIGASGNHILPPYVLALSGLTLSAAYTSRELATTILRGTDLSYGVYIYHMPIYNFILYKKLAWTWESFIVLAVCSISSWKLVEKPSLARKSSKQSDSVRRTI